MIIARWDGESLRPARLAQAKDLEVGAHYQLEVVEQRSAASHRHYFALVREAWASLPDELEHEFPTPEHLRKWALIKAGYHDETIYAVRSQDEAFRFATLIRKLDEYSVVVVEMDCVKHLTAKSQSTRAMGKTVFQESKDRVLDIIADLIGADVREDESDG